jgi:hypothetical protein
MPMKDETIICATRARHGIVAYHGLATPPRDWTLASAPTQYEYGILLRSCPGQLYPLPAPATNWQKPLASCRRS